MHRFEVINKVIFI